MHKLLKALLISGFAAILLPTEGQANGSAPLLRLVASDTAAGLKAMEGKRVLGKSRELLGHVGMVDVQAKVAELKVPTGAIVSIATDLLIDDGEDLSAPSLSRGDVIAMINKPGEGPHVHEVGAAPGAAP